jgi:hypothetical protein
LRAAPLRSIRHTILRRALHHVDDIDAFGALYPS